MKKIFWDENKLGNYKFDYINSLSKGASIKAHQIKQEAQKDKDIFLFFCARG